MNEIRLTAKFTIQNGKSEEFKSIASKCVVAVRENEKGKSCSQYDWFFSADGKICHVLETYANSDAVIAHMANVGELLGQLLQISSLSGDIYGELSDELQEAFKGLDIKLFTFYQGA